MYDAGIIACFVVLIWLGGVFMEGVIELYKIRQGKLARAIANHPAGRKMQ